MSEVLTGSASGLRARHETLRDLLDRNGDLLELMADIQLDLRLLVPGDPVIRTRTLRLLEATLLQAQALNLLSGQRYRTLYEVQAGIEADVRRVLEDERRRLRSDPLAVRLRDCHRAHQPLVGGKAARLGELARHLPERVPDGFVVTTAACSRVLAHVRTGARLRELMKTIDVEGDATRIRSLAAAARSLVLEAPIPPEVEEAIRERAAALHADGAWAVRSSAVGEDGTLSFAGQFETVLEVSERELPSAWRHVVASIFSEHVMRYRLACGLFELTTPMAVLCMPMVAARSAGVLYTRHPAEPERGRVLVNALRGLAVDLVGGVADAETTAVSRDTLAVESRAPASVLSDAELTGLARLGLEAEALFGEPLDVEWAIDDSGHARLLQARPLASGPPAESIEAELDAPWLVRGGFTVVGGRAVGPVSILRTPEEAEDVPDGCILVVPRAVPELGHLLPGIEGLVAEHGSVAGHLASLAREFGVPSVFGMSGATTGLSEGQTVSLDAGRAQVHPGEAWPRDREARGRARALRSRPRSPLHSLILHLDLTDPRASSFRPRGCRSLHDIVRLCHERGVAAVFEPGEWRHGARRAGARRRRGAGFPVGLWVLDVGGGVARAACEAADLDPAQVLSRPFQALWRGMTAPGIAWSGRRSVDLRGVASVMSSSLAEAGRDADSLGQAAYLIVARDYVNLNARMAYHYAMVDALVGETPESNSVRFRFWGGGAGRAQRDLRARFLAEVLERRGFAVERRGDLVTARMQRHGWEASEEALDVLGRLMGCARQLDMLLRSEGSVAGYVAHFLAGRYEEFA